MIKTIFLTLFFIFYFQVSCSQIQMIVTKAKVQNIYINKKILFGEELEGPIIDFNCVLINTSNNKYIFYPKFSQFIIIYKYNNEVFKKNIFLWSNYDQLDSLILNSNEAISYHLVETIFLGTYICDYNKYDYSKELFEVLPSLTFYYKENGKLICYTKKIEELILILKKENRGYNLIKSW